MSAVWGSKIKYTIFGESHGNALGIVIDGLKPGIKLDIDFIRKEMQRRAPGSSELTTPRKEGDEFEILSGYFNDRTTGTPLTAIIRNTNQKSKDYDKVKSLMRPGHADYTGFIKYGGFNDIRGGGHFSGRVTAPFVFAGAIAKQILMDKGIFIGSHIYSLYNCISDTPFNECNLSKDLLLSLCSEKVPFVEKSNVNLSYDLVNNIKREMDSIGGVVEAAVLNLPVGLGDPFFNSVESNLSHILFSIPGIKGIEFGTGFEITKMKGSEANDEFYYSQDQVRTYSNNNGGINGGITNGMPLIFRCAVKPTPSISKTQRTINIESEENETLSVHGRHDPCILFRAIPVIESAAAICILEYLEY